MCDAPLESWEPVKNCEYFAHVCSSNDAMGVGISVCYVSSGLVPARGVDTDPNDGYDGDVLKDRLGNPLANGDVEYSTSKKKRVALVKTDMNGRHQVWLEPGYYYYRVTDDYGIIPRPEMEPDGWAPILVQPMRKIAWEYVNDAGETVSLKRDLAFCTEDLICDWNASDGLMFAWPDVEETIVRIAEKAGTLRQVTFSKFVRPDMIALLQQRGVPARDLPWTDRHVAAAFRSFVALSGARYCVVKRHERANAQFRLVRNIAETRTIDVPSGEAVYLAMARAGALYFAAQSASRMQTGARTAYSVATDNELPGLHGRLGPGETPRGFQGPGYRTHS